MGRAPCCDKSRVKKGPWSPEEDAKLKSYIEKHGTGGNWIALPHKIGLRRCGKSCRLRWLNYLRPNIKHGGFSEEEDNFICSLYLSIGSRWSIIAAQLPGRTDNDIKNYWNTKLKKKLLLLPNINNNNMKQYFGRKTNLIIPSLVSRHHDVITNNFLVDDYDQPAAPPLTNSFPITTTTTTSSEHMVYRGNYSTSSSSAANNNNIIIHDDDDQGLIMPPSLLQPNNNYNYINSSTFLDHTLLEYYLDIGNINLKKNIMFINNGSCYMSYTTAASPSPSPEDMIISSDDVSADEVAMPPPPPRDHQDYFTFRQESTTYTADNLMMISPNIYVNGNVNVNGMANL